MSYAHIFFLNFLKTHMPELLYVFICSCYDEVGNAYLYNRKKQT